MELREIQEIIAEVLQIDPDDITEDKNFETDLGADSLDRVEIVMSFEDRYGITIPDDDIEGIKTVGDAFEKIKELL